MNRILLSFYAAPTLLIDSSVSFRSRSLSSTILGSLIRLQRDIRSRRDMNVAPKQQR